jgi:hypothetical protein
MPTLGVTSRTFSVIEELWGPARLTFVARAFLGDPTELPWSALGMRMGDWGRRSLARELDGSGLHW